MAVTLLVAYLGAPQLDNMVALIGAFCCTPIAFIFPACELWWWYGGGTLNALLFLFLLPLYPPFVLTLLHSFTPHSTYLPWVQGSMP